MRLKLLLLLLFASSMLYAQGPYRNLIFSEANISEAHWSYFELTNMGEKTVDLSEFEVGMITPWMNPWTTADSLTGGPDYNHRLRLPKKMLAPGKSFLVSVWYNLNRDLSPIWPEKFQGNRRTSDIMMKTADMLVSPNETASGYPGYEAYDTITPGWQVLGEVWSGRDCWFLRHFYLNESNQPDSMVVDAVHANFNDLTSSGGGRTTDLMGGDCAGITEATRTNILVRKYSIKQGVGESWTSWELTKGVDINDSEWLPLPLFPTGRDSWVWGHEEREEFWTLGNHGNFLLNVNTLKSSTVKQDWVNGTLTVDYGARKCDGLMRQFEKKDGLAWFYKNAPTHADSAYNSVRTGDTLIVYAVGTTLLQKKFALIAAEPKPDAKVIIPMNGFDPEDNEWGGAPFIVTENMPGMDTITANPVGIPFATRVDSLMKYLEKPANATWKVIFVDSKERVDLKLGDILRVTAKDGSTKDYYLKVGPYLPSHNAYLSSITWPEIPEWFIDLYGWKGDTIPSFAPVTYSYKVDIPSDTEGFPAFVATPEDLNTRVEVQRATSLSGSAEDKTIIFKTTAEDDTTLLTYKVELNKLKDTENVQPWKGEPFISQFVWQDQWASGYIEVVNPGTEILDLSNYMFAWGYANTPAAAIARQSGADNWANRYAVYIPGYKWTADQASWQAKPRMAIQDLNVSSIVYPGDVFVVGDTRSTSQSAPYPQWGGNNCDIDLATGRNPWGETVPNWEALQQWNGANWYLFRIDNDSITRGLKPAIDPNDFTLLDVFGSGDESAPVVGGKAIEQTTGYYRKPEIYQGNPYFKGSFGTDAATSEWLRVDRPYFQAKGIDWPLDILSICDGLGQHFMNTVTVYKSTVGSLEYKVSEGFSMNESIRGVKTGTDVNSFLAKIIKADPGQFLKLKKASTGAILAGADMLSLNDTLIVVSADSTNTTKYILNVTQEGLSSDAKLTSAKYTIVVNGATGTISGFDYGTTVKTVFENVTKPLNSILTIVDENDAYVAFQKMNFDTVKVFTQATDKIFFEVIAENGTTKILYQLKPNASSSDAFITSELYQIDQASGLVSLLPRGTTVPTFLQNITPVSGSSLKIIDKAGFERTLGEMSLDDKVIVTSKDGKTVKVYFLSMLQEEFQATKYAAYVTSPVYNVNQVWMVISGPTGKTLLTDFYSKIVPAFGAKAVVINAKGEENKTADLNGGDRLKVTAADGLTVAWYTLQLDLTNLSETGAAGLSVYPNPTNGPVSISGLSYGNRIQVYNLLGAPVLSVVAGNNLETVSLGNQPSGMYFITVSDGNSIKGKFKIVKQ